MKNNLFTRFLEIVWLFVGLIAAYAATNSFMHQDNKNGYLMALFSLISFAMFFLRRHIRLHRKK